MGISTYISNFGEKKGTFIRFITCETRKKDVR